METRAEALRRGVNETLDSVVSPAVRDTMIAEALDVASLAELPTDPRDFRAFLAGPLRNVIERALGFQLGRSVVDELTRLSDMPPEETPSSALAAARVRAARSPALMEGRDPPVPPVPPVRRTGTLPAESGPPSRRAVTPTDAPSASGRPFTLPAGTKPSDSPTVSYTSELSEMERRSRAPTAPSIPAVRWSEPRPPASGDFPSGTADALGMQPPDSSRGTSLRRLPMVFVASRDPELVGRFAAWLDPRAVVVRVGRLMDLLLDLEDVGARRTVIVFDCRNPPWRIEALSAIAEELADECRVVLWGATRDTQLDLLRISPRVTNWVACPGSMPLAAVVERCSELVG